VWRRKTKTAPHYIVDIVKEMENDQYGILIHSFNKNIREQVRVSINEYMGKKYLDIRVFYKKDDRYLPSKKGVTIPEEHYPDLLEGIVLLGETQGYDLQSDD
jgi:hypothetical protein